MFMISAPLCESSAQCCLGLIDLRLEQLGVDQRDQLAFRYLRIEISVKSFDVARHLTADLHVDNRVERARSRDTRLYQSPFQRYCLVGNRGLRMHPPQFSGYGKSDDQAYCQCPLGPFRSTAALGLILEEWKRAGM